ncbi:hypothetical protein [Xanthomonas fragariae]|nr:hypothetical protein [Xanthomonas fragariae]WAT16303.1 hypothetical protein OZ429_08640 [Xanthomonas fragariae]
MLTHVPMRSLSAPASFFSTLHDIARRGYTQRLTVPQVQALR